MDIKFQWNDATTDAVKYVNTLFMNMPAVDTNSTLYDEVTKAYVKGRKQEFDNLKVLMDAQQINIEALEFNIEGHKNASKYHKEQFEKLSSMIENLKQENNMLNNKFIKFKKLSLFNRIFRWSKYA